MLVRLAKYFELRECGRKIHLARGEQVVQNALSSQNIVAISFPIDFPRVRADKQLGVTHQSAVHALVFRTSECHTGNGHIRCGSREDQSQDLSVRD